MSVISLSGSLFASVVLADNNSVHININFPTISLFLRNEVIFILNGRYVMHVLCMYVYYLGLKCVLCMYLVFFFKLSVG